MKASCGNGTNMFVVSIYFPLKKNTGIEKDTFFRDLTDICAPLRAGPTWECWLSGLKRLSFYSSIKNMIKKISTEFSTVKELNVKSNNKSQIKDKILALGEKEIF